MLRKLYRVSGNASKEACSRESQGGGGLSYGNGASEM